MANIAGEDERSPRTAGGKKREGNGGGHLREMQFHGRVKQEQGIITELVLTVHDRLSRALPLISRRGGKAGQAG